ncbi:hypothetical protein AXG93_2717s1060 [Marchantia polymorpha subsp. ruderalis]|uniref:Uncharacterized protein n=1 Tax=Marchantia polymorpha subsp. ruderalis TaxID=1480154 RepID=A0A176VT14_MARPO|nr:hypothetical protein AXG93_2717s1060 [Marchantia polymorpha subsp. ruderalis]
MAGHFKDMNPGTSIGYSDGTQAHWFKDSRSVAILSGRRAVAFDVDSCIRNAKIEFDRIRFASWKNSDSIRYKSKKAYVSNSDLLPTEKENGGHS